MTAVSHDDIPLEELHYFDVEEIQLDDFDGEDEDIVVIPLTVRLPDGDVETGYGTRWPEVMQDLPHYMSLGVAAGFDIVADDQQIRVLRLQFRKPT